MPKSKVARPEENICNSWAARGSICEVETQLYLAHCLGYSYNESLARAQKLCDECGRILNVMTQKLKQSKT